MKIAAPDDKVSNGVYKRHLNPKMHGSVLARGAPLSGRTFFPTRDACSTQDSVDKNVGPEETEESVKKTGTFWRDVANARNNGESAMDFVKQKKEC